MLIIITRNCLCLVTPVAYTHDITDRHDAYYKSDPNTRYDILKKRWVPRTAKHDVNDQRDPYYRRDPTTIWDIVQKNGFLQARRARVSKPSPT